MGETNDELCKERDILLEREQRIKNKMDDFCDSDDIKMDFEISKTDSSIYDIFNTKENDIIDDGLEDVLSKKIEQSMNYKKILDKEIKSEERKINESINWKERLRDNDKN